MHHPQLSEGGYLPIVRRNYKWCRCTSSQICSLLHQKRVAASSINVWLIHTEFGSFYLMSLDHLQVEAIPFSMKRFRHAWNRQQAEAMQGLKPYSEALTRQMENRLGFEILVYLLCILNARTFTASHVATGISDRRVKQSKIITVEYLSGS